MAQFNLSGSGFLDLTTTDLSSFDGLFFMTTGNLTVRVTAFQIMEFGTFAAFTGSGFRDTVEVIASPGQVVNGSNWVLNGWTANRDGFRFIDMAGNDTITGSQGNDTISITQGLNTADGAGGDDLLVIDWTGDTGAFGMASATTITDFSNTQVSFANIERIDLTLGSGNDNVSTGAGNDTLNGGAGNDTLNSGAGAAVVDGGGDTDLWVADFSNDATAKTIDLSLTGVQVAGNGTTYVNVERLNMTGGAGNDRFQTRTDNANDGRNDTLNGGFGNDTLVVGGGLDVVNGGDGDDLLVIDWSTDAGAFTMAAATTITDSSNTQVNFSNIERIDLTLGSGNDNVSTGAGNDTLRGGDGNDTLNSGAGRADVNGGIGTDLWVADFSAVNQARTINLNLAGRQAAGNQTFYEGVERLNVIGGAGNDRFETRTDNANDGRADGLFGGLGNDTLVVGGGIDTVDGGEGDDLLIVNWSTDTGAFGMASTTAISDFSNTQVNFFNIERMDITLGSGNDNVSTGAGNDTLNGGAGNDTLNSSAGAAVVDGGGDTDLWVADFSADPTAKTINLSLTGVQNAGNGTTYVNVERLNVIGGAGNDRFETRTDNANDGRADGLFGGLGNDTLVVGGGIDTVDGGDGDDLLIVNWSTDTGTFGMASATAISDFSNTQVNFFNIERMDITLGSGSDNVSTGAGNDTLNGGAGNDTLNSGAGAAVIDGGGGTDLWQADFSADPTAKTINLSLTGVQNAGNGTTYVNVERLNVIGGAGNDRFETRTGSPNDGLNDTLNGGAGNDTLVVGGGLDVVEGGNGDDLLIVDWSSETAGFGMANVNVISDFSNTQISYSTVERVDLRLGSGNDNVTTGAGNDTIRGGGGNDTLNGGDGVDVLDFADATSGVRVTYNAQGIGLATGTGLGTVTFQGFESFSGGAAGDRLTGTSGSDTLVGNDGNDVIRAGGDADVVIGGTGRDTLSGGNGADQFVFQTASDSRAGTTQRDTITDFDPLRDKINMVALSQLLGGSGPLVFVGSGPFTALGQVRAFDDGVETTVEVNLLGNLDADMAIRLTGLLTLDAGDFLFV